MKNDLELMKLQAEALFVHDRNGRLTRINEAVTQAAPRFFWGQTKMGPVLRFRDDMPDSLVEEIQRLMEREEANVKLPHIIRVLEKQKEIGSLWMGPAYTFLETENDPTEAVLVTESNKECLSDGFPGLYAELEQRGPCFMIVEDGRAVSVCFSARSTDKAAEAGVATLKDHRGKGYALRTASSWGDAIRLSNRIPLYSTSWDNYASQSIAARLGLHVYGTDISIY